MKLHTLSLAVWFGLLSASAAWAQGGPPGALVRDFLVVGDADRVYAATDSGVFLSRDAGRSWREVGAGLPAVPIRSIAGTPERLFVAVDDVDFGGVFVSRNEGPWEPTNNGITDLRVLSVGDDPQDRDILFAGTNADGVFRSTDGGVNWTRVAGLPQDGVYLDIEVAPNDSQRIFAAAGAGALFESTNGGQTWTPVAQGFANFSRVRFDPLDPNIVYATTSAGLIRRPGQGQSFGQVLGAGGGTFFDVAIDPRDSDVLIVPTVPQGFQPVSMLRSVDRGASWTPIGSGLPTVFINAFAFVETEDGPRLLGGAQGTGVFASTDLGTSWALSSSGLNGADVRALAVDPTNGDIVYATVDGGGLFKSTDGGATWNESRNGLFVRSPRQLAIDPVNPRTLYAGSVNPFNNFDGAVVRSLDGGANWETVLVQTPVFALATHPTDGESFFVGTSPGQNPFFNPLPSLFRAHERGDRVQGIFGGDGVLINLNITDIAVDPADPDNVFLLGQDVLNGPWFFLRSDDGGANFAIEASDPDVPLIDIAIDPTDPRRIYLATFGAGVFRFDDGGRDGPFDASGDLPDAALVVASLAIDRDAGPALFASTADGVFKTLDGGATWTLADSGLEAVQVRRIFADPSRAGVLYAATAGSGVFRTVDGGERWAPAAAPPAISPGGVVSGAEFAGPVSGVAPGEIVSIFGQGLGPVEGVIVGLDPETGRLATEAAGVRVLFNGVAAPLFFVRADQINCQVPFEVAGAPTVEIRVEFQGIPGEAVSEAVLTSRPALFAGSDGSAAALNQDNSFHTAERPARVGEVIQLFATGQGPVDPPIATGALAEPPLPTPTGTVEVLIDGRPADVPFAGLAPNFAGLLQVNAVIPPGTPAGSVSVELRIGGQSSQRERTVHVAE